MFPPPPLQGESKGDGKLAKRVIKFLLSGGETTELFRLDTVFFQNWYGCHDEVVMGGGRMDLIQVLCVGYNVPFAQPPHLFPA